MNADQRARRTAARQQQAATSTNAANTYDLTIDLDERATAPARRK